MEMIDAVKHIHTRSHQHLDVHHGVLVVLLHLVERVPPLLQHAEGRLHLLLSREKEFEKVINITS